MGWQIMKYIGNDCALFLIKIKNGVGVLSPYKTSSYVGKLYYSLYDYFPKTPIIKEEDLK